MPTKFPYIYSRWKTVFGFAVLGLVLSLGASFVQPLQYASTVRLLVLQDIGAVDAYTAGRSVERLAENFSRIVFTTKFFDEVIKSGFDIEEGYFPEREDKRRKQWVRMVETTVSRGTGLLTIRVYHPDVLQAEQMVHAIAFVLERDANLYAPGSQVDVELVDTALNSRFPVKPNILSNAISGFVLGGLVGLAYLFLQAEKIRRRHQLVHEDD